MHGSGFRHMMVVIRARPGVTTHEVSEAQPVQVREVTIPVGGENPILSNDGVSSNAGVVHDPAWDQTLNM